MALPPISSTEPVKREALPLFPLNNTRPIEAGFFRYFLWWCLCCKPVKRKHFRYFLYLESS
jgi:hypothetical protein